MRPNKSYEQRGRNSAQVEHIYDWNNCRLWDIYEFISKIVMNKKYQQNIIFMTEHPINIQLLNIDK